jgi:hypothetical protein
MNENINLDKNIQKIEEDMIIIKYNKLRNELEEEFTNKRIELTNCWIEERKKLKEKYKC